ncbi:DUF2894 domain-containing protein [Burkholderia alba]|uniref:DUF2894 domain-containing protein n=1 Tax=Burkholderia alba TaxID=2683677 RepID=UPI002B05C880|nr:DUF2894 domain-containing protein [Burkholderia alba]
MTSGAPSVRATLEAWRAQGADRLNPVRFRLIDALAQRAARHDGAARQRLDARLAELLDAYAGDLEKQAAEGGDAGGAPVPPEPARGALGELVDHVAARGFARDGERGAADGLLRAAAYPELPALDHFREIWSRVSADKQLRQSMEQVPANAGPLNSSSLVHRSLSLMRALSPGYFQQFLSYVDALSWLERMNGGAAAGKEAPRAGSTRKGARGASR